MKTIVKSESFCELLLDEKEGRKRRKLKIVYDEDEKRNDGKNVVLYNFLFYVDFPFFSNHLSSNL